MLLDQETLRFIFGLKLRTFRQQKQLSLQELSRTTKLSPSYLNEIEKGKKYPKSDKVALLAQSLGVSYDDLVSIKLSKELGLLSQIFEKNLLRGMPLHIFGIPGQALLELAAERPQQAGALFGMVLEIVRNHQLNIEEFFFAILRAYLDMNSNYFPEIEQSAKDFKTQFGLGLAPINPNRLKAILEDEFDYIVTESDFSEMEPGAKDLYTIFSQQDRPYLFINKAVDERERIFILLRELGFSYLKLKERNASNATSFDSFDQLFNNFKASYFSSAILIPEKPFVKEIGAFFDKRTWDTQAFLEWVLSYQGTVESFFHRLSQLLPRHFGMEELFYLRFNYGEEAQQYSLSRELHLSSLHGPHKARDTEHYCRRWLTLSLLEKSLKERGDFWVDAQRSAFFGTENEYLCLTVVKTSELCAKKRTSYTLGLHVNEKVKKHIQFLHDPAIVVRQVGDTCERCGIEDCKERAAPASHYERSIQGERTQKAIAEATEKLLNTAMLN